MGFKPWIPHFGNELPYTTSEEDEIELLEARLAELKGK